LLSLTLLEQTQEIMSFCSDAPPVTICLLKRQVDFIYVLDTRGVRGREKLLTQTPPVKKIFKDRQCICVRESGT
jgi:hypothetical protein